MTPKDALILLDKAASVVNTSRAEHIQLQQAITVLSERIFPPEIEVADLQVEDKPQS